MTTDELNAIVQAVMSELEKAGVDFDFKAEIPQADDLVYVMRGTSDKYQGITVKWQNLLDIIVQKATEAKNEAVSAKDIALQTLATIQGIESNVSSMKSSVETSEANVASMKASVETSEARVTQIKSEAEQTLAEATQTVTGKADKTYVDGELAKKADITYVDGKLANKADKSELAVERARIDSLSTLPEGSTTGDAELIDLRIGADGVTYGNAGNAVRTQFSDLKGDLKKLGFEEIIEQSDIISAQGITITLADDNSIWNSSGSISTNINYYRAINEPIPVESGKTYLFEGLYGDQYTHGQLIFFDSSMKNGVQVTVSSNSMEYTVPDGKCFVTLTMNRSYVSNLSLVKIIGDVGTGVFKSNNVVLTDEQIESVVSNIPNNSIKPIQTNFAELVDDESFEDTVNIVDGITWTSGYMRHTNGSLVSSEHTTSYNASDFIPIVSGYKYRIYVEGGQEVYAVYFDDTKTNGTSVNYGWVNNGDFIDITVPSYAKYVSFNSVSSYSTVYIDIMHRLTQTEDEKSIVIPRLKTDVNNPLKDKVIVNFGDSIFGQARPPVDVSTFLANETGATVYNCGFGGCQMTQHAQSLYDPFSMYRIADAITSNDWSLQDASISAGGIPDYFSETIALLKTIDFSKVDIVTIGYGINDFNNGASLTAETFNGFKYAMKYSIETLLNAYPNLRIYVCTMTYGFSTDGSGDTDTFEHTSWVDSITTKYTDWVEMQKTIAREYHLPIIDNYYDLGINSFNKLHYFSSGDGTHQALEGRKLIAKHMAKCLW